MRAHIAPSAAPEAGFEWPTFGLVALCHALWGGLLLAHSALPAPLVVAGVALLAALHSSLQHEALHGHPTRSRRVNEALVALPIGLSYPYRRFRALHIRHHKTPELTDPYDDPESFYLAWGDWAALPRPLRALLAFNNTLLGRLLVGPALGLTGFLLHETGLVRRGGEPGLSLAWSLHLIGAAAVVGLVLVSGLGLPLYLLGCYLGLSLLSLRTFAEHEAADGHDGRTAVIEASPVFALLFLNNNLHAVHHRHPGLPWYRLPEAWRRERDAITAAGARRFSGYAEVARRYLFRRRDAVPHPFLHRDAA